MIMGLGEIEFEEQRILFRKELEEKCRKAAEERGEKFEIITREIPFINDDVPRYLAFLEKFEEKSRKKSGIIVKNYMEKVG